MYESITRIRVRYSETDQMEVVYYGNYATFFEVGRVESIRQLGYSYKEMENDGIIMPVVETHIRYLRSAVYDDLLTIKTTLKELPKGHKIEFYQEVFNENNKLLTAGRVVLYFLEKESKKRTVIPEILKSKLAPFF